MKAIPKWLKRGCIIGLVTDRGLILYEIDGALLSQEELRLYLSRVMVAPADSEYVLWCFSGVRFCRDDCLVVIHDLKDICVYKKVHDKME